MKCSSWYYIKQNKKCLIKCVDGSLARNNSAMLVMLIFKNNTLRLQITL